MASDAYRVGMETQMARFHEALNAGMPRLGWKVALSDASAMQRLGIDEPAVAWLDGNRLLRPGDAYLAPAGARTAVEAEVAIRIDESGTIEAVAPAIEFIDLSRPGGAIDIILSHAVFHDAVLLGQEQPFGDWVNSNWPPNGWPTISKNGVVADILQPSMAPGDFAALAAAKSTQLRTAGEKLEADDWIITGSLTTPVPAGEGDEITIEYGVLGTLTVRIGNAG
ncbi:MAG: hypothetical protein R3C29_10150 [Dehalococcoidia bacterium]